MIWINYDEIKPPKDIKKFLWCDGNGEIWVGKKRVYATKPVYLSHLPPLPLAIQRLLKYSNE